MTLLSLPWLEIAIAFPLVGALCVGWVRDPDRASRWGILVTGGTLALTLFAVLVFFQGVPSEGVQRACLGHEPLAVDELNAPIIVVVALLHFLTTVATARTKMRRFSLSWSLLSESIRLATFACRQPWLLIALLAAGTLTPLVELRNRRKPSRIYLLHMGLTVGLLVLGWAFVDPADDRRAQTAWATIPLLAAVLVRCGAAPLHIWLTDWFEQASFGNAMLFVAPLTGVHAALRLVLPIAPDWVLGSIGTISLITAVYAAGMTLVQRDARRFFAFLFLSHSSLVLVGLQLHTPISVSASLCLWITVALSLGGFGLTLRALESRVGRLDLSDYHGLYNQSPTLAICFLLTGLASVGFPGTVGYIATEMLIDGAVETHLMIGIAVIAATALNGMAVVRAYLLLFTGRPRQSAVTLNITPRERFAVLTTAAIIILGGLVPTAAVHNRYRTAAALLRRRASTESASPVAATIIHGNVVTALSPKSAMSIQPSLLKSSAEL